MRRSYLFLGLLLLVILLIQLIRPEKNLGESSPPEDFILASRVPDTLASIFQNSCYDCHSDRTNYPWYGNIAPATWLMNRHIKAGKAHLNFSSWAVMDKAKKISQLDQICSECSGGSMPLSSYLLLHRSATLGPDNIEAICDWAYKESIEIMNSKE